MVLYNKISLTRLPPQDSILNLHIDMLILNVSIDWLDRWPVEGQRWTNGAETYKMQMFSYKRPRKSLLV